MDTQPCPACWVMVPSKVMERHDAWHRQISQIAIESTQRIDALTNRIQEIEAGYGDR